MYYLFTNACIIPYEFEFEMQKHRHNFQFRRQTTQHHMKNQNIVSARPLSALNFVIRKIEQTVPNELINNNLPDF